MEEQKFSLTVYHADQCGKPQNCLYPHERTATTVEELKPLLCNDHVFIRFKGNYRSKCNFVQATTVTFDCDNDHSDEPSEWIKPEDMPDIFPGVRCFTDTSRHHMKQKGDRSPRPRFHVTFETDTFTDSDSYTAFMKKVQGLYPFFDDGTLDAARFFFGNPDAKI